VGLEIIIIKSAIVISIVAIDRRLTPVGQFHPQDERRLHPSWRENLREHTSHFSRVSTLNGHPWHPTDTSLQKTPTRWPVDSRAVHNTVHMMLHCAQMSFHTIAVLTLMTAPPLPDMDVLCDRPPTKIVRFLHICRRWTAVVPRWMLGITKDCSHTTHPGLRRPARGCHHVTLAEHTHVLDGICVRWNEHAMDPEALSGIAI
jgi:hypothetical protein